MAVLASFHFIFFMVFTWWGRACDILIQPVVTDAMIPNMFIFLFIFSVLHNKSIFEKKNHIFVSPFSESSIYLFFQAMVLCEGLFFVGWGDVFIRTIVRYITTFWLLHIMFFGMRGDPKMTVLALLFLFFTVFSWSYDIFIQPVITDAAICNMSVYFICFIFYNFFLLFFGEKRTFFHTWNLYYFIFIKHFFSSLFYTLCPP